MRVIAILLSTVAIATAADRPPFYVAGGYSLFENEMRELTRKFPWTVGLGWGESQPALIGAPSLDLEWTHASGNGNKYDAWSVTYNERALLSDSLYFGFGIGSYYNKIKATDKNGNRYDGERWFPGGRGMIGLYLGGGRYGSLFTELAYTYRGKVEGINANNLSLIVGLWF